MRKTMRRTRSRAAFTLLEVLMVVAIIGLLAAFVVPQLFRTQGVAQRDLEQATVDKGFGGALDLYKLHMRRYPTEDDGGLLALVEPPEDEEEEKRWAGPYLKPDQLRDSWGTDYIYESPGEYNQDSYDLSSAGPDRDPNSDDDIKNWRED